MGKKVFVSYNHEQGEWVWNRLVPCLKAGGAEVFIDRERFVAGKAVIGQMDATQDAADMSVLVLSPEYLKSPYCVHEMDRAINRDPQFQRGLVVPVKRVECTLPDRIRIPDPLCVNLGDDNDAEQWDKLLKACDADLGADAHHWLNTRDQILRCLQNNQSVNLVVSGNPKWRELINHLNNDHLEDLRVVDLENPAVATRPALVKEIIKVYGGKVPDISHEPGEDLVELDYTLTTRPVVSRLVFTHFDIVRDRPHWDVNLFAALKYLLDNKKLVLLVESRISFSELMPQFNPLSEVIIQMVELRGKT